ncbi:hypothetical protein KFU94_46625 [Chloroflexi bacterium TSY]|nr:hypothetical protein [Chloroflexi bacterium TSY]
MVTNIVAALMSQWGWSVWTVSVADARAMFQGVAHADHATTWFDLTLCYIDANDRDLFFEYGISVLPVGDGYAQSNGKQMAVLSYAGIPARMEFEDPCIWAFIKNLDFGNAQLQGNNPRVWIEQHRDLVDSWGSCAGKRGEGS